MITWNLSKYFFLYLNLHKKTGTRFFKGNSYTNACFKFQCDPKLITSNKNLKDAYLSFHWFNDSYTCGFELVTRGFEPLTRGFELVTRGFELLTHRFKLLTHRFELVICGFELVSRGFELALLNFNLCF